MRPNPHIHMRWVWPSLTYLQTIIIFSPWQYLVSGVNISWNYIFTPDNIWRGGEYIVTLYFHSWRYLVRGWLYRDIIFSPLTIFGEGWLYCNIIFSLLAIFGEGVIKSWHYIIIPDTTLESGTGCDYIWIFSLSKFDSAVIPGFNYSYPYIHPMILGGWNDYI